MIRYRFIPGLKRYHLGSGCFYSQPQRNRKTSGFGGTMVARLKLEGIDGKLPPDVESAAQFDPTRKIYQTQKLYGTTD